MTNDEIVGTVSLSRMMGAVFTTVHIYNETGDRVSLAVDLKEDERTIWRYYVVFDVPSSMTNGSPEELTMYSFLDDLDDAYNRALDGDEELFAEGELMEDDND